MFNFNEINTLKSALPTKGILKIKELTGLSIPTIYKFFNKEKVKTHTAEKIWKAGWRVIKEHEERISELRVLSNIQQ